MVSSLDTMISIVVLLALAAPIGLAAAWFTSNGPAALAGFFRADHSLGWPHGVQEEDPPAWNWDRRGSAAQTGEAADGAPEAPLERVAFRLARRCRPPGGRGPRSR